MKELKQGIFTGERALYAERECRIVDSVFCDGESPLKESRDISLLGCIFKWKYPIWYSKNIRAESTTLLETARSGIWYTHGIEMTDCVIEAPKTFRRSSGITLTDCVMPIAQETLWYCKDVKLKRVGLKGDYFGFSSENIEADGLTIDGNYAFDGAKNIVIRNSRLISKDAFWNCENVTVYDSLIIGEYLAWNSKNVTFINCTIESNQGLCYIEGLKLVDCKLINTDLCFELVSDVDATVNSKIDSVKNPISGKIVAEEIGTLIMDRKFVDPEKTEIVAAIGEVQNEV